MPADNRNQFLDAGDSEEDVGRDDSEDNLQKGGRSTKRRRVDDEESGGEDFSDEEQGHSDPDDAAGEDAADGASKQAAGDRTHPSRKDGKSMPAKGVELPGVTKPLTKPNLVSTDAAIKKSGVVYISRVPPYMNPAKLRSLLEPYGKINRLFLAPEDPSARSRRIKGGGNKKRSFTEGWVEFVRKKDAKKACELLNAQTIGGKKGTYYRDDIWNLLYLSGFKWHNLTEQISAENAERASRMRAEISKTTKENKEFVRNVERAKMLDGMHTKAAAKRKREKEEGSNDNGKPASAKDAETHKERKQTFKQVPLEKKRKHDEEQPEQVQRVLSKIF